MASKRPNLATLYIHQSGDAHCMLCVCSLPEKKRIKFGDRLVQRIVQMHEYSMYYMYYIYYNVSQTNAADKQDEAEGSWCGEL